MVCERRRIQEMLDGFSETLSKIRDGDLVHHQIYHRDGDHWWIENVVYEKNSDGKLARTS